VTEPLNPFEAFLTSLAEVAPDAATACSEWIVHELVAHLAAGVEESAELIEDVLAERTNRPTRSFDEREAPFRALPDEELRKALGVQIERVVAALGGLAELGPDATFEFFNRPFTASELQTHAGGPVRLPPLGLRWRLPRTSWPQPRRAGATQCGHPRWPRPAGAPR
jgi:hypothetical protein